MNMQHLTPFILAGLSLLTGVAAWLVKRSVSQGEALVALQTAFKFYLDNKTKGAAMVLDSPNPTPDKMRVLLKKYYEGEATKAEIKELAEWLESLVTAPGIPKSERSAAIDVLAGMGAMRILDRKHANGHR